MSKRLGCVDIFCHPREGRPLHNHRHSRTPTRRSREACPREDGEREPRTEGLVAIHQKHIEVMLVSYELQAKNPLSLRERAGVGVNCNPGLRGWLLRTRKCGNSINVGVGVGCVAGCAAYPALPAPPSTGRSAGCGALSVCPTAASRSGSASEELPGLRLLSNLQMPNTSSQTLKSWI